MPTKLLAPISRIPRPEWLADEGERLIPMRTVVAITSWSRTSIIRLIAENKFPSPVRLGKHKIAFRESEIRHYVLTRSRNVVSAGAQ